VIETIFNHYNEFMILLLDYLCVTINNLTIYQLLLSIKSLKKITPIFETIFAVV